VLINTELEISIYESNANDIERKVIMKTQSMVLVQLVSKLPDPDEQGMLTNIDKQEVDNIIAEIHKGGRDSIVGLVEMLVQQGEGDDFKPRYALHCLALHVCKLRDDKHRRAFSETLAEQLEGDLPKVVTGYLIQELQTVGGKEVVGTLGKLLHDKELYEHAALALTSIGGDGAAEQFRGALPRARGKRRLTILLSLGVLRDATSVKALKKAVGSKEQETRLIAVWALANIGDAGSVDLLLKAADTEDAYERIKATHACLILAENLLASGKSKEAVKIYTHLCDTRTDPAEHYVCDAAKRGLAAAGLK